MIHRNLIITGIIGILLGASASYLILNKAPSLEYEISSLKSNIKNLQQQLDLKNSQLDILALTIENHEEQIISKNSQIDSLNSEIVDLEYTLSLRDQEISELINLISNTQSIIHITDQEVRGQLTEDQIWSGLISITDHILVPKNVTLTILPGSIIQFKHYRGYKDPEMRLGLTVLGTLRAVGNPDNLIWFTSDADDPINGDWGMIRFENASPECILMYSVIEFGQQGINLWKSNITISHNIVRWHNWEGIYLESYCRPLIAYNRIYQNGYNGIAMEQYNDAILIQNMISYSGTNGVHVDASKATIINCNVSYNKAHGISVDDHGEIISIGNTLQGNGVGYGFGEGQNNFTAIDNFVFGNDLDIPSVGSDVIFENIPGDGASSFEFDYEIPIKYDLGYIPGAPEDRYLYVYPDVDETRHVINKIGEGLGLTWSVTWDGDHIWTAVPWGIVYKLDPNNGTILSQFNFPGPQAWGMTFDGKHLWINDFAEKKVYEMDTQGKVISSFLIPDVTGGAKGITWNGEYLCIMGWANPFIYIVDQNGTLVESISVGGVGGGITWDGEYFWAPGGRGIAKISREGQIIGSIYAASEGTWDLAWDGKYLWATQRSNENWMDAKLYQIEIIDIT